MSNNVSSFISKLDKLNDKSLEVFVPSKNKKVKVKPLTLKQQKDLISSVLDGVKGSLNFSQTLNNIIIDNSGLADLKVVDKILPEGIGWDNVEGSGKTNNLSKTNPGSNGIQIGYSNVLDGDTAASEL